MEVANDETEASTTSPACLVLPVNPLPSSDESPIHDKGTKRKAKRYKMTREKKHRKILSDFPECTDTKEGILDSVEAIGINESSQSQAMQEDILPLETESEEVPIDPVTQSWFTSRDSKDNLSKKGHRWKQGMWSKEEVDILERNINDYLKHYKLGDAVSVIFQMTKEERKDFYRFIARGLQRPLFAVYRRVRRMYDSKNHVGKYTAEDIEKLKELRAKYGNEWCVIGAEMGRSAASVKDKVRLLKDECHQGKWTIKEEQMLTEAVYSSSNAVPGESITTGISWSQVAAQVPTRTEKQCRAKWLNYLNWKHAGGTEWTKEDDDKLLERLAESEASNDSQVDWEEMAQNWTSVRSPQWLRSKWWMLKRHVPGHVEMDLATLIKILRTNPVGCKQTKSVRASKRLATDASLSVPMATLTMPLGTSAEQVGVYQYEVLDTSMGITPSSTYVIQSPSGHHAEAGSSTEGYIVATMQGEQLQSNENVTVHLNHVNRQLIPSSQLIISAVRKNPVISTSAIRNTSKRSYISNKHSPAGDLSTRGEDSADGLPVHIPLPVEVHLSESEDLDDQSDPSDENSINQSQLISGHEGQLTSDITQSEQAEDNSLNQSEMIEGHDRRLTGDISQSDQSEEHTLSNPSQLIGTDAVLTQQDMVPEVSEESEPQLVIVDTAPSTGLIHVQPEGSVDDSHLPGGVFSLSGQMLPSQSDGSDLLESPTSHLTRDKMSGPLPSELP